MANQLTQEQLEMLVELNSQNDLGMRLYSGRGMYGEYCLAFTGDDLLGVLSNVFESKKRFNGFGNYSIFS